jgi:hypothetical protein
VASRRGRRYTPEAMSTVAPALIGPEQIALIQRRVSIIVASRDAALCPHLVRALGCRLSLDACHVTLFLCATSSKAVIEDLRANRLIAVVFSEPSTNRSLQLKGNDATIHPVEPGDRRLVQTYVEGFAEEIAGLGFAREVAKTLFDHEPGDLVAVRFTPRLGFEQTPGPRAGEALEDLRG